MPAEDVAAQLAAGARACDLAGLWRVTPEVVHWRLHTLPESAVDVMRRTA